LSNSALQISDTSSQKKLISVIIPAYQEEKIIGNLNKIYTPELKKKYDFEIILSDGGSKDKTVEMATAFADKIVVHTSDYRQTISEGRNKGAEKAEGEVLVFINADTYPQNFEKFFSYISNWAREKSTKFNAIACEVFGFPDEITNGDRIFYAWHNKYVHFLNKINLGMGRGECQIVRTDYFLRVNGYNPHIVAGEDFDLFRRLSKITKIKFVPELVVLESPRRFREYGYLKTLWFWTLNSISIIFSGQSYSKEWEAIR
jgi:glycosyltransferase involved in cell wall biosynthesis